MLGRFLLASVVVSLLVIVGCTKKEETSKAEEQTKKVGTIAMKVTDPVCGMLIEKEQALKAEHSGMTHYFCAEQCKENFLKEPHKYLEGMKVVDPVCGMEIEHKGAGIPHIATRYQGKTYHFCSVDCKDKFEREPGKFLK